LPQSTRIASSPSRDEQVIASNIWADVLEKAGPSNQTSAPGHRRAVDGLNLTGFKSLDEAGSLSVAVLKNAEVQVDAKLTTDAIATLTRTSRRSRSVRGPARAPDNPRR
jgi:hypothetical protein